MGKKEAMVNALCKELELRKTEFSGVSVETIYFGGGTPSVLETEEIEQLIDAVREHYNVVDNPEITLEANPDDLSEEKILQLAASPINRLSIGIQSFFEEDLLVMNRAHNAMEAKKCLQLALQYLNLTTLLNCPKHTYWLLKPLMELIHQSILWCYQKRKL